MLIPISSLIDSATIILVANALVLQESLFVHSCTKHAFHESSRDWSDGSRMLPCIVLGESVEVAIRRRSGCLLSLAIVPSHLTYSSRK